MTDSSRHRSTHFVRPARLEDARAIRTVARESWHAAYDDLLGSDTVETVTDEWYGLEGLRESIQSRDSHLFVAPESDDDEADRTDDLAGFVHVGQWPDEPAVGHLARLYVHSSHWGRGLGTSLCERGERALEDDGYDRIRLEVFAKNERALDFYESRGYESVAEVVEELEGKTYRVSLLERSL
ncbi:GNAT family N-acetyltransferase [Saliphagus sp. GCM10025334]